MSHQKFKICPVCGEHNPTSRFECSNCETDLTSIEVVDESILQKSDSENEKSVDNLNIATSMLVKRCDCGQINHSQTRKCNSCGEDISDIQPTTANELNNATEFLLRAIHDGFVFPFNQSLTIMGRGAELSEYLSHKLFVSRQHAKFTVVGADVYIENLSSTNRTFINNSLIPDKTPTLLKNGDEIGLGGKVINESRQDQAAYFVFEVTQ